MTTAIIMAGGKDAKWGGHLGVRRHFAPIAGEPLLQRTVRQLEACGVGDIVIVAPPLVEYQLPETRRVSPERADWGMEALNGAAEWSRVGRTIQVYGDTVFTDAAMDTIVGYADRRWQIFGRHDAGGVSPWGELFAISFWPEHRATWLAALEHVFALKAAGVIRRAGSWEAYRYLGGARDSDIAKHRRYPSLFTEIGDGTDDFDTPAEYEAIVAQLAVAV